MQITRLAIIVVLTLASVGCGDTAAEAAHAAQTLHEAKEAQDAFIAALGNPTQLVLIMDETRAYCGYGGLGPCHFAGISKHFKQIPVGSQLMSITAAPYNANPDGAYKLTFRDLGNRQCRALTTPVMAANFLNISISTSNGTPSKSCQSSGNIVVLLGR